MFKKPLSNLKTSAPLRSSDRRKLKQRVAYWSPDGDPLWFSLAKDADELIPTVYTLWKKYDLLPCITTPTAVIPVLMGGADLMIPGVVQILSSQTLVPPQLVAISQYIKDSPTTCGPPLAPEGKGKRLHLLHSWKDCLFNVGSRVDPPGVVEIQEVGESKEGAEGQAAETDITGKQDEPKVSTILRNAVLQAIRATLKSLPTSSFPVPAGTFYSSYILPYRPAFVHIKHSTYKSLAAFLKVLDKQEPLVMSVAASHSEVLSHTPYVSLRDIQLKEEKREKREEEEKARVQEMEIKELWKPHAPSGSGRFFSEGGFDSSALYTYAELKATVIKYITARHLVNAHDQSYVNVSQDEVLLSIVAGKNDSDESLEFLKREEVVQKLSEKMQNWYEIRAEGREPLLRKGQLKPISVVAKTRQGRRANTLISGFEPFLLEADEMAEELRRICAGSTGVSPLPGKAVRSEVLVQGKQIKAVTDFLLSRGVPKKWIETADLTVKK
ncbi:hypothetical protein EDD16DRAFT_1778141 [Pisolithus croceorrhizus]|nr:hypothetical protein EDD16DRAFT_1778141 [Pisolithus croceorrhizus]